MLPYALADTYWGRRNVAWVAYDYPGSCAPSRWLPSALKQNDERRSCDRSSMRSSSVSHACCKWCLHLQFRIIPQYVSDFQPRTMILLPGTRNILPTECRVPSSGLRSIRETSRRILIGELGSLLNHGRIRTPRPARGSRFPITALRGAVCVLSRPIRGQPCSCAPARHVPLTIFASAWLVFAGSSLEEYPAKYGKARAPHPKSGEDTARIVEDAFNYAVALGRHDLPFLRLPPSFEHPSCFKLLRRMLFHEGLKEVGAVNSHFSVHGTVRIIAHSVHLSPYTTHAGPAAP